MKLYEKEIKEIEKLTNCSFCQKRLPGRGRKGKKGVCSSCYNSLANGVKARPINISQFVELSNREKKRTLIKCQKKHDEFVEKLKRDNVEELAKFMHEVYEQYAKLNGWDTQESCKVEFEDLPEKNKKVMIHTALQVITRNNIRADKISGGLEK